LNRREEGSFLSQEEKCQQLVLSPIGERESSEKGASKQQIKLHLWQAVSDEFFHILELLLATGMHQTLVGLELVVWQKGLEES